MAIISVVGRKDPKIRLLIAGIYFILIAGSLTMLIPFVTMVGDSVRSQADRREIGGHGLIPKYLYDEDNLYRKFVHEKYGDKPTGGLERLNSKYKTDYIWPKDIEVMRYEAASDRNKVNDWNEFKESMLQESPDYFTPYYVVSQYGALSKQLWLVAEKYVTFLEERYGKDIDRLNDAYKEESLHFNKVAFFYEQYEMRSWIPGPGSRKFLDWRDFKQSLPGEFLRFVALDWEYKKYLNRQFSQVEELNSTLGTNYPSIGGVTLPDRLPKDPEHAEVWESFVRTKFPIRYMDIGQAKNDYPVFLSAKYKGKISSLNRFYRESFNSFDDIAFPKDLSGIASKDGDTKEFIASKVPATEFTLLTPRNLFHRYLQNKYGDIASLNAEYDTEYSSFTEAAFPIRENDWIYFKDHKLDVFKRFLRINYSIAGDYLIFNSRGVFNTLAFCTIMVVASLIINPLCAYALSRFQLSCTYQILLFLLATMAFPAEVAMIPNFLLLKELGMLNTLWALALPVLANGYGIFLLKGFFDSLPVELFEAGIIDGASELRMFLSVAVPLSKPIFAVLGLGAFTFAYGSFMWAFIVNQDERFWTLMVYLYQLQNAPGVPDGVKAAALVIAAIPTLLVFIFCQKIILRGIIIPQFK